MLGRIHLLGKKSTLPIKEKFKPWDRENVLERIEKIELEINKKAERDDFDRLVLESIKTKKNLIHQICTRENLWSAYQKTSKGKRI